MPKEGAVVEVDQEVMGAVAVVEAPAALEDIITGPLPVIITRAEVIRPAPAAVSLYFISDWENWSEKIVGAQELF